MCKDVLELKAKGMKAVYTLKSQKWFSLGLNPKFIATIYDTYVRSIVVYGSELLSSEERRSLLELDELLIRTYLKGLLKLKSTDLAYKHEKRLQLVLRLPSMGMVMESRCMSRVEAWAKKCSCENEKAAMHARQSMADINNLQDGHPLRQALSKIEVGETERSIRDKQWKQMELDSKGANPQTIRHIHTVKSGNYGNSHQFPRFLRDPKLEPSLKRAMLRWCIYNFPVRCKPS